MLLVLAGCAAPTPVELAGRYERTYEGFGVETIELKADGNLIQTFKATRSGNSYRWEGKWHTEGSSGLEVEGVADVWDKPDSKGERVRGVMSMIIHSSGGEVSSLQIGEEGSEIWERVSFGDH